MPARRWIVLEFDVFVISEPSSLSIDRHGLEQGKLGDRGSDCA